MKKEKNPLEKIYFPVTKVNAQDYFGTSIAFAQSMTHLIVVDTPNGKLAVNACSKNYELISNKELVQPIFEKLGGTHELKVKVSQRDYSKFYVDFNVMDKSIKLKKDDIFPRIRLINSYDGSIKYSFYFGLHRLVCGNGASVPVKGTKDMHVKMMHTPYAGDEKALIKSLAAMEEFIHAAPEMVKKYLPLMQKKMSFEGAIERMEEVKLQTDYPTKLMEQAAARMKVEMGLGYPIDDFLLYNAMNFALYNSDNAMLEHKKDKLDQSLINYLYEDDV